MGKKEQQRLKSMVQKWDNVKKQDKSERFVPLSCRIHESKAKKFSDIAKKLNTNVYHLIQAWVNETIEDEENIDE
ncbi:MAG: hypothetical protein LBV22_01935 [Mycoplasmataceae bacterium]|jgi:hypothetical protein|nr:hypothetical protein [Mycoplasmataceae bacterium]